MKPAIFEEVENQLINALISHDLHGVSTADMHGIVYNQDNTYQGQQLVDSVDEIIPVILKPLMDEAIAEMNASNINQLVEAMVYVIGMSIKQEREDG